jgi:hypothetical protein
MANMSYCRFENTLRDLYDCYNNLDSSLSGREKMSRKSLVELCQSIVDEYDPSVDEEEEDLVESN